MSINSYFHRKRVAITGGSSGIGLAMAELLVGANAELVLLARRRDALEQAKERLRRRAPHASVQIATCDVGRAEEVNRTLGPIAAERLDVLVCSAGIVTPGRFVELEGEAFRAHMDVNYFGVVHACRAVAPHFIARRSGHIINVGSFAGVIGIYGYSAYAPTKFAVAGLSQSIRAELRPHGVRVTVAHPPDTDTPMLEREAELRPAETRAIIGSTEPRSARDVAHAILDGASRGAFDVWGDRTSWLMSLAQGVWPSLVRWVCDAAQSKA